MTTFKEKLAAARLPERTVEICLRGDLQADFEVAEKALVEALAAAKTSNSKEGPGVAQYVEAVKAIQEQMADSIETFRIRALKSQHYRALVDAYPPREREDGTFDESDLQLGFNRITFFAALVRASTVSPDMGVDVDAYFAEAIAARAAGADIPLIPEGDWPKLVEELTDKQWSDLVDAAFYSTKAEVGVPKSLAVLQATRPTDSE